MTNQDSLVPSLFSFQRDVKAPLSFTGKTEKGLRENWPSL